MIKIPGVRSAVGATTADVIVEQIRLCKNALGAIERIAVYRKQRELRDEVGRRLRGCHDFLGMAGSRKRGCLYLEVGLDKSMPTVCEHAIPVSELVSLYQAGVPFECLVFYPVALISKESDMKFGPLGLVRSGPSLEMPFMRYYEAGVFLETHDGIAVSCESWTMEDHWDLVRSTPELYSVRKDVLRKLTALDG